MVATGTIRTATERRLLEVFAELDGFSAKPSRNEFLVTTPPAAGKALPNRRCVYIGIPDGAIEPEGIESGRGPSTDAWVIPCSVFCTDVPDPLDAKQTVETALNAMADELARDGRLAMTDGPRDLSITQLDGPKFAWDQNRTPGAWIDFDITCFADIRRNP